MSLKSALSMAHDIEIKNGILTISEIDNNFRLATTFSCFLEDISIYHPQYGKGTIVDFDKDKWIINFEHSTSLQEFKTRSFLHYINN